MSYNLVYKLINNGTAYEINADYANATGELVDLIIPATYQGLPVISIGNYAFEGCTSLTSVTIPDSVTSIGNYAFEGCTSLDSIEIPDSVTSIGNYAFYCCDSLTSVTIGNNVTAIGSDTFGYCINLKSVIIPDSVTSIGNYAFEGCTSLTSVTIPDSVTTIGYGVFYDCTNLKSIILLNKTPISIDINCFTGISTSSKFYCYYSAIEKYKTATNWNTYADRFIADDMRLYFTMNARAQKKYFVTKEEVSKIKESKIVEIYVWGADD